MVFVDRYRRKSQVPIQRMNNKQTRMHENFRRSQCFKYFIKKRLRTALNAVVNHSIWQLCSKLVTSTH